ncbi:MAG TPA: hypothetical protein VK142_11710 [Bacillota bacterium]|nr:hypothetical protein [Bacillota bacterium]
MFGIVVDFSFSGFVETMPVAFVVMIVVFGLAMMLRSLLFAIIQLILVLGMYTFDLSVSPALMYVAIGIQFILGLFLLYKYFVALERNYLLILEKTHQAPPHYTKGNQGEQKAFM